RLVVVEDSPCIGQRSPTEGHDLLLPCDVRLVRHVVVVRAVTECQLAARPLAGAAALRHAGLRVVVAELLVRHAAAGRVAQVVRWRRKYEVHSGDGWAYVSAVAMKDRHSTMLVVGLHFSAANASMAMIIGCRRRAARGART